jgi:hypothetical protein
MHGAQVNIPTDDELTETDEEEELIACKPLVAGSVAETGELLLTHSRPMKATGDVGELLLEPTRPMNATGDLGELLLEPSRPMHSTGVLVPNRSTKGTGELVARVPEHSRTNAVQMVDYYFSFNGIQVGLYMANIEGIDRVLVVPNMLVTDLVAHCVDIEAQKEARRYYSNKLLEAVAPAKASTGVYISIIGRRNAIFAACYLEVLKDLLETKGSPSALVWQKITTHLCNFPANKERPKKRQRKACAIQATY